MIVDRLEAFAALDSYGIRVARITYVDSAQDAMAFAADRDAPDRRLTPIVLRPFVGDHQGRVGFEPTAPLASDAEIREAYERAVREQGTAGGKIVAQWVTPGGSDITATGMADEKLGRTLALHSATHSVQRVIPLGEAGAAALVQSFEGFAHRDSLERVRPVLEHLVLKLSHFFEATPVTKFEIDIRLHDDTYTVIDASMTAPGPLASRGEAYSI